MKLLVVALLSFAISLSSETPLQEVVSANNLFALSVYREILKTQNGNFLMSPYSAEVILALTQSGAKDETAEELRSALHLPNDQQTIESGFETLQSSLKNNKDYTLKSANKIYLKENFQIRHEFRKVATDSFDSELELIDFTEKVEAAKTMNEWVEKRTENKIQNLISPDLLDAKTVMILINALYFKGKWTIPFNERLTKKENFYKTDTDVVQVDTMHSSASYNYHECTELDAKFLKLTFEGNSVSITFVLPNNNEGLPGLEKRLQNIFPKPKYDKVQVDVSLPKFKIESSVDFKEILYNLGVRKAFTSEADLSGIAGQKGDLVISQVLQKSFINVNEAGVEAAAATFVGISPTSIQFPTKEFIANRPFAFYIEDDDVIIFAGRVLLPTQ